MKRDWEIHELIEQWTLVPRELELLRNRRMAKILTRKGHLILEALAGGASK